MTNVAASRLRTGALVILVAAALVSGCAATGGRAGFDEAEIRAAERALVEALESAEPTAWVDAYTEDAIFVHPASPAVQGRKALLQMALAMKPLSSVSIRPVRTEGDGRLATVYGHASWVNGRPPHAGPVSNMRLIIVWRKEADGRWRIAQELLNAEPAAAK